MYDDEFLCVRGDEIDNAVYAAVCAVAQPGYQVPWSQEIIGNIADYVEGFLAERQIPTCRPWVDEEERICYSLPDKCAYCKKPV